MHSISANHLPPLQQHAVKFHERRARLHSDHAAAAAALQRAWFLNFKGHPLVSLHYTAVTEYAAFLTTMIETSDSKISPLPLLPSHIEWAD